MRILLIDDHELVWSGTRRLLEQVQGSLGDASGLHFEAMRDVESACQLTDRAFDLILLDMMLPGVSGIEALHRVQAEFAGAVVCAMSGDVQPQRIREVLESGAGGFIPKIYSSAEMASAMALVFRRKVYIPAEFLLAEDVQRAPLADEVHTDEIETFLREELSERQRQVLTLALQGLPNKLIARRLNIAEGTVKAHLSMVYRALGVQNRVGAMCRVLGASAADALQA